VTRPATTKDPEVVAGRLLRASVDNSYDPDVDIDWAAPPAPDTFYAPVERISLYGTPLWERLGRQRQIELSKHEVASIASVGVEFELILMQMLVRHAYDRDMTSRHFQYALTEIGDECRHSVMFGRMISTFGCPAYGLGRRVHREARFLKSTAAGPLLFAAALIAEEMLDTLQREAMADESVQPLVRMVSRIHVVEEARHVRFAREEIRRQVGELSRVDLAYTRLMLGRIAAHLAASLIHPGCYAAVGLDPAEARAAARVSPYHRRMMADVGRRPSGFLAEVGLIAGPGRLAWRRSGLLG
jgi:hypothetical protein